jgi:hypothetical protein
VRPYLKKNPSQEKVLWGGLQSVTPEFKCQYHRNKTKQNKKDDVIYTGRGRRQEGTLDARWGV